MGDAAGPEDSRNRTFTKKRAADNEEGSINQGPNKRQRSPSSQLQGNAKPTAFAGWNRGVKSQVRPSLGRPRLGSKQAVPSAATRLEFAGEPAPSTVTCQPEPIEELSSAGKERALREPVVKPTAASPEPEDQDSSSEEGEIQSVFSGDDEAVVIHVDKHDSGLESGEISEDHDASSADGLNGATDSDSGSESEEDMDVSDGQSSRASRLSRHGTPSGPIDLEDEEDPRMNYASGQPVPPPPSARVPPSAFTNINAEATPTTTDSQKATSQHKTLTLADLSLDDLRLQLRYFHHGEEASTIPLTSRVHCLSCGGPDHQSAACQELKCRHCGTWNSHFTDACPTAVSCNKCGQSGHERTSCPLPLREHPEDFVCQLCQCRAHAATDCERRWRTSAFPPGALDVRRLKLYCYECGNSGHLGNDCQSRRPGKSAGTSMWSVTTMKGGPIPSANLDSERQTASSQRQPRSGRPRGRGEQQTADEGLRIADTKSRSGPKKQAGAPGMKINPRIAANRPDLQGPPLNGAGPSPRQSGQPRPPPPGDDAGKKSKKPAGHRGKSKSKANRGAAAVRPMPSAAKKAHVQGRS